MPDDTQENKNGTKRQSHETDDNVLSRRNILLGSSALVAAATLTSGALAQAQKAAPAADQDASRTSSSSSATTSDRPISAPIRLAWWATDAEYRPDRQGRHDVHRLLCREQLHGWPLLLHHRPGACAPAFRKVGIPGAAVGLQAATSTIAEALKPLGYATGQFGKNHLGDRDEYLPTMHGFDEFFGNLYHLNAEEEPERPDYPKDPDSRNDSDRGACSSARPATATIRPSIRASADRQADIEDTGPLNRKRMETIDDETTAAAIDFMQRQARANKPFFTWMNTTRMHVFTHVRPNPCRARAACPATNTADGMIEHDGDVGKLLKALDDLGIANNTIVVYTHRQRSAHDLVAGRRR